MPETPQISASSGSAHITSPETSAPHPGINRTAHIAEVRAARAAGVRWRRIARWSGLGIFLLGAALLIFVFVQAFHGLEYYGKPDRFSSDLNSVQGEGIPAAIIAVGAVFGTAVLRVLYLFILGFIASAVAARGIQFFAASEAVIDEAVVPEDVL